MLTIFHVRSLLYAFSPSAFLFLAPTVLISFPAPAVLVSFPAPTVLVSFPLPAFAPLLPVPRAVPQLLAQTPGNGSEVANEALGGAAVSRDPPHALVAVQMHA